MPPTGCFVVHGLRGLRLIPPQIARTWGLSTTPPPFRSCSRKACTVKVRAVAEAYSLELDFYLELAVINMEMNLLRMYFEGSLKYVQMDTMIHDSIKGMQKWLYLFTDVAPQA